MKQIIKRLILSMSVPLQWCIRDELIRIRQSEAQDIGLELQRRSLQATADYVQRKLKNVDSVTTTFAVLDVAIANISSSDGLILEFGVFEGRSIRYLARLVNQPIFGFDSFEGLPERWRDGFGAGHFKVRRLPSVPENVELIKGWFSETLPIFLRDNPKPVKILHIDCDLYSSTVTVLENLSDRIVKGTVIIFDDYFNYPGWEHGEHKAFQEFCEKHQVKYRYLSYNAKHEQVAIIITEAPDNTRPAMLDRSGA